MAKLVSCWAKNADTVPSDYILPPESRPGNFIAVGKDIPVIDLGENNRADLAIKIVKAFQEFGLFQVINHGVSKYTSQDAKSLFKELFNMSEEDKASLYSEDYSNTCRLYTGSNFKRDKDLVWKDTMLQDCYPLEENVLRWPEKPTQYREVMAKYSVEVRKLGLRILELLRQGLGLEEGYFEGEQTQNQSMSINYYPPCPDPSLSLGIAAHIDPNTLTVLEQDISGLQIHKDGQWLGVEPLPNAFVVNGGCQLQLITNGKIKGADHRVVTNSKAARTSIVTFFSPKSTDKVEPAKEIVTSSNETPRFKGYVWDDFMVNYHNFLDKGTYGVGTPLDPCKSS